MAFIFSLVGAIMDKLQSDSYAKKTIKKTANHSPNQKNLEERVAKEGFSGRVKYSIENGKYFYKIPESIIIKISFTFKNKKIPI